MDVADASTVSLGIDEFSSQEFPTGEPSLSYDDNVAYEDQKPDPSQQAALASRIGSTRVYLLSETASSKSTKRKREETEDEDDDEDVEMDEDTVTRGNAILLQGSPISKLPTARIFAYATNFDAKPMGLEWVDDTTCILVFESKNSARDGYRFLLKSPTEEPDPLEGLVTAKPFPVTLWPPEDRINKTLGKGEGLKGTIRMRWARTDDVKKKGAKQQSQFYKKHGDHAGKESVNNGSGPPKRRRANDGDPALAARLDMELEDFLAGEDDDEREPSAPPSKMYSDYIAADGRTLLDRTSNMRAHFGSDHSEDLASRLSSGRYRRSERRPSRERGDRRRDNGMATGGRSTRRPHKTQKELDDELDAFLNEKS